MTKYLKNEIPVTLDGSLWLMQIDAGMLTCTLQNYNSEHAKLWPYLK